LVTLLENYTRPLIGKNFHKVEVKIILTPFLHDGFKAIKLVTLMKICA